VIDYVFRWLGIHYKTAESVDANPDQEDAATTALLAAGPERVVAIRGGRTDEPRSASGGQADAPPCRVCGTITERRGACYTCPSCGENSGCG
jgi:ribonucleoside-diphosphate reductase alpha chain